MRSEFNCVGAEYRPAQEYQKLQDPDAIAFQEIASPAEEIAPCAPEFLDMAEGETEQKSEQNRSEKRRKAKQKGQHLVRRMSYLVASVVSVAIVSATLNGGSILENVQALGGETRGDLRFSIQWNDGRYNPNDIDAHCMEPGGYDIYYGNARIESPSGGTLDVDIVQPQQGVDAIENIIYPHQRDMEDGVYKLYVHCFSQRGGKDGFSAEVAIRGRVYKFEYKNRMTQGQSVHVANVIVEKGRMTIEKILE